MLSVEGLKHGRLPLPFERVHVFRNLTRKCWSVRDSKGRTICHANRAFLRAVSWVVQPGGRRRVLEQQKKYVHAFGVGLWLTEEQSLEERSRLGRPVELVQVGGPTGPMVGISPLQKQEITYNPFKFASFVDRCQENRPVSGSMLASFCLNAEQQHGQVIGYERRSSDS